MPGSSTEHPDGAARGVLSAQVRRHTVDAELALPLARDNITVLFGPSGSGKTTVLRAIAGLDRSVGGRVSFDGVMWDDGRRQLVRPRHRRVGYLFQDHALFPHLSVEANVGYGLPRSGLSRSERHRRVQEALRVAEAAECVSRQVSHLSGGESQRVALARALASGPQLLLLDEPLSALDTPTRVRLRDQLRHILRRVEVPTIIVTHDRAEALALADRVVVLVDGRVRQIGSPVEVFDRPADPAVAAVVGIETAAPGLVTAVTDDLVTVTAGHAEVTAVNPSGGPGSTQPGDAVLVCIRAEDVALEAPRASAVAHSARNRLAATVTGLQADGPLVRVELDAGFRLTAYITRPAREELELAPGSQVTAIVKSPAVHLVARGDGVTTGAGRAPT